MRKCSVRSAVLAGAAMVSVGTVAKADIIYQDYFDGTAGVVSGRTPDQATGLDGGTSGATWISDAAPVVGGNPDAVWTASGGTYSGTGTTNASIGAFATGADSNLITNSWLPFVPQSGYIYDAQLIIASSGVGASTNWLGLTFAPANMNGHTTGGSASALSNLNGWGLVIDKGTGQVQSFGGPDTSGTGTANAEMSSGTGFLTEGTTTPVYNTFDIILNTTGTHWTVSWLVNGVTPTGIGNTSYTYNTNPSIGNIVFGTNKLTGVVSNFSLTTVPEPASMGILGLGSLVLLRRRSARK